MICDICQENESIINVNRADITGKIYTIHICAKCAADFRINTNTNEVPQPVMQYLQNLLIKKITAENSRCCPVCGQRLGTLKLDFRAGCPECYAIFKTEIIELLQNKGIKSAYTGSLPHRLSSFKSSLTDRMAIQAKLEKAIDNEEYEKAAVYRDYLRALEKTAVNSDEDLETDDYE